MLQYHIHESHVCVDERKKAQGTQTQAASPAEAAPATSQLRSTVPTDEDELSLRKCATLFVFVDIM